MKPSGIRLGTPAITTRGLGVSEMVQVGGWIHRVLTEPENEASLRQIRTEVVALTSKFPIPSKKPLDVPCGTTKGFLIPYEEGLLFFNPQRGSCRGCFNVQIILFV